MERILFDEGFDIYASRMNFLSWIKEELTHLNITGEHERRKFILIAKQSLSTARLTENDEY